MASSTLGIVPNVKSARPTRAERALETRRRMLDSAKAEILAHGYAASTMSAIADRAGVAVQTLYYTFRTKGMLLREVMETTAGGGSDPGPISHRRWLEEIMSSATPQRSLALSAELGGTVYEHAAPLWPAIRAAALTDPEVDRYWHEVADSRRKGMERMVDAIAASGVLRAGLTPRRATDLVDALAGHDTFQSLVIDAKWTLGEYKSWLFATLVCQLLGPVGIDPEAIAGLSFEHLTHDRASTPAS